MVWVGRDLKDRLVPAPRHGQGHLPLDQAAQSPIQPGLERFRGVCQIFFLQVHLFSDKYLISSLKFNFKLAFPPSSLKQFSLALVLPVLLHFEDSPLDFPKLQSP